MAELRWRNVAAGTIYKRRRCGSCSPSGCTAAVERRQPVDVEVFLDGRSISPRTRYDWVSHLHMIFDWGVRHGLADHDPTVRVHRPKVDRLLPRPISDHDLAEALRQAPPMMRAWLLLGALAGLRVSEMARPERPDVLESDMLLRVMGKGRKERLVPLHPDVLGGLRRAGLPRSGYLFRRPHGSPFPASMVSREISVYLSTVGIDATAHQLRHWFGTKTYRQCRDLRTVQELLGHASPTTTAIYTAASPLDARAAVDALAMPA
ncbi:MAG: tyrosine-type recombinase/integrase [Acidimicrobiales bacterium]